MPRIRITRNKPRREPLVFVNHRTGRMFCAPLPTPNGVWLGLHIRHRHRTYRVCRIDGHANGKTFVYVEREDSPMDCCFMCGRKF